MSSGATKDYNFGQKNNWRRTVWNEVLRRARPRVEHHPVLYLAGPQDSDRSIAASKGVPHWNLIGIDRNSGNVERLKSQRRLSIHADALEVLKAWPHTRPVAAVFLDFCSGLEKAILEKSFSDALSRDVFEGSAVVFNFQRGRDSSTNSFREVFVHHRGLPGDLPKGYFLDLVSRSQHVRHLSELTQASTNRALQWVSFDLIVKSAVIAETTGMDGREFLSPLLAFMRPSFASYKSGALTFDSVVFRPVTFSDFSKFGVSFPRDANERLVDMLGRDKALSRRINALLAVRTIKMGRLA